MALVVVERSFPEAHSLADLETLERQAAGCFEQQRVIWLRTLQSRDQRYIVSVYDAPDLEAVRVTQRTAGLPFERVWGARLLQIEAAGAADPAAKTQVVVQRAMPAPVDEEMVWAMVKAGKDCLSTYRSSLIESYLALEGRRTVCCYRAPDAESVRLASAQTQTPFERAWPASEYRPEAVQ